MTNKIFKYILAFFWFCALVLRFIPLQLPDLPGIVLLAALIFTILYLFFYLLSAQLRKKNVFAASEPIPPPIPYLPTEIQIAANRNGGSKSFDWDLGPTVSKTFFANLKAAFFVCLLLAVLLALRDPSLLFSMAFLWLCLIVFIAVCAYSSISIFYDFSRLEFTSQGIVFYSPMALRSHFGRTATVLYDNCKVLESYAWLKQPRFFLIFRSSGKRILAVPDSDWSDSYQALRLEIANRLRPDQYRFGRNSPFMNW